MTDPTLAAPEGVAVEGEFKRITVTWTAPEGSEPDYVIVNVKKASFCVCVCIVRGKLVEVSSVLESISSDSGEAVVCRWIELSSRHHTNHQPKTHTTRRSVNESNT